MKASLLVLLFLTSLEAQAAMTYEIRKNAVSLLEFPTAPSYLSCHPGNIISFESLPPHAKKKFYLKAHPLQNQGEALCSAILTDGTSLNFRLQLSAKLSPHIVIDPPMTETPTSSNYALALLQKLLQKPDYQFEEVEQLPKTTITTKSDTTYELVYQLAEQGLKAWKLQLSTPHEIDASNLLLPEGTNKIFATSGMNHQGKNYLYVITTQSTSWNELKELLP